MNRKAVTPSRAFHRDYASWSGLCIASGLCAFLACGCASRHTTANRPAPPASQPSTDSADREGSVNRGTSGAGASVSSSPKGASATSAANGAASGILPGVAYTEQGNASWYGIPFHGRHASNGEVYDMNKLTAAHRTLPFNTKVRVTNLVNGKSTVVRITDRGPFVQGRIIDLSMAAAREIDSIGAGVVPVRLEILSGGNLESGFFTVQVGAFRDRANAVRLRERLSNAYSPIFIQNYDSPEGIYYRVRVGKVSGEDAARQFGDQLRSREGFTTFVVRLDEGERDGGS